MASAIEGLARFGEYETWYRVTGDLKARKAPLVVLHGTSSRESRAWPGLLRL